MQARGAVPLSTATAAVPVSVLILTRNEAQDLPGCLASVAWCDDVHVYDSHSTDGTADLARRHGATVWLNEAAAGGLSFGGDEAAHRNWGLRHIAFRHPWVLQLDADERVTPALAAGIAAAVADPGACVAFRIQRRDYFSQRWLRHVQASPFFIRLFRPERLTFERLINPVSRVDGPVGDVAGPLDHFPFSKGLHHWLDRHNSYSTLEARQIRENRRAGAAFSWREAFFGGDFHTRRFHQKELFYRLPFRPLVKFLLLYVARRGFLDGRAGFTYACLQSFYEYMIVLKTRELDDTGSRAP